MTEQICFIPSIQQAEVQTSASMSYNKDQVKSSTVVIQVLGLNMGLVHQLIKKALKGTAFTSGVTLFFFVSIHY